MGSRDPRGKGASTWPPPPSAYDPSPRVPLRLIPEGLRRPAALSRLFRKGEHSYDDLWRYVRKVDRSVYVGQGSEVRVGEYEIGLRGPARIPCWIDLRRQLLFLGRKLTVPFGSLRALLAAHGMIPSLVGPRFDLLLRVDGCAEYLPIHRFGEAEEIVELAEFLSKRLHIPLGIASRPLGFLLEPGGAALRHGSGETPLHELRGLMSHHDPAGSSRVQLVVGSEQRLLAEVSDASGALARAGAVADDLIAVAARRYRSQYGQGAD